MILTIDTNACKDTKDEVNYLEHVQAFLTLKSSRRGNTVIFLTSPLGTRSVKTFLFVFESKSIISFSLFSSLILSRRPLDDDSTKGFYKWPFMTTHAWAERAQGRWTLEIRFDSDENPLNRTEEQTIGELLEWSLVLHGTKSSPYADQTPLTMHGDKSKLAIVKQIHANHFQDKAKYVQLLKQDNQKRLGSDDEMLM